jgi:hypothetical protein
LLAANERLLALRKQVQAARGKEQTPRATINPPWQIAEPSPHSSSTSDYLSQLPSHLGWESNAASQAIRGAISRHNPKPNAVTDEQLKAGHPYSRSMSDGNHPDSQPVGVSEKAQIGSQLRLPLYGDTVKHYPSIGISA